MIARSKKQSKKKIPINWNWKLLSKSILFVVFISLSLLLFHKNSQDIRFPIKTVKVFGLRNADRNEIQKNIAPLVAKGFFSVDVERIKEQVQHSPWIMNVFVQRLWPDQVFIRLEERIPVARWNKSSLLSLSGELFLPKEADSLALPEFIGPEGEHVHMLQYFKKINSILGPLHFKISKMELLPSLSWNLTFDNGIKISAGHKDVLTHIGHFVKVYPKIIGKRAADVDYIDLRYPNGLAVRWKSHNVNLEV